MEKINLRVGQEIWYFHPNDEDCFTGKTTRRKPVSCVITVIGDVADKKYGRRIALSIAGRDTPSYIFEHYFRTTEKRPATCFLTKQDAIKAIIDAGYEY